jgi:hypothetical protein
MESTLVHRAIAEEAQRRAFDAAIFQTVREAETQRRLAGHDAVTAPVVLVRREVVHRAALAARATGRLAEELGHALVHAHPDRQGVAVVAVGGDDVIVRPITETVPTATDSWPM